MPSTNLRRNSGTKDTELLPDPNPDTSGPPDGSFTPKMLGACPADKVPAPVPTKQEKKEQFIDTNLASFSALLSDHAQAPARAASLQESKHYSPRVASDHSLSPVHLDKKAAWTVEYVSSGTAAQ